MHDSRKRYEDYIASEHWAELRQKKFKEVGRLCQVCSSNSKIHVHHINYRNFTDCAVSDLAVLCEPCHNVLHSQLSTLGLKSYDAALDRIKELVLRFLPKHKIKKLKKREKKRNKFKRASLEVFGNGPFIGKSDKDILRKVIARFQSLDYPADMAIELRDALRYYIRAKSLKLEPSFNSIKKLVECEPPALNPNEPF